MPQKKPKEKVPVFPTELWVHEEPLCGGDRYLACDTDFEDVENDEFVARYKLTGIQRKKVYHRVEDV